MAASDRDQDAALKGIEAELFGTPDAFEFFQAVRLLESLHAGRTPVGSLGPPALEAVRFGNDPKLAFPPAAIRELALAPIPLEPDRPPDPPRMAVSFLGLLGAQGALPTSDTERVLRRLRVQDTALADFLDLFQHRLVSLFYRAWERHQVDQRSGPGPRGSANSPLARWLASLGGIETAPAGDPNRLVSEALLEYVGLFSMRSRSAVGLEQLLGRVFGDPIAVDQCIGKWVNLHPNDLSKFNIRGDRGPRMGGNAMIGRRVWDAQASFRIRIGPVSYARFLDWRPDRARFRTLVRLTRRHVGPEFEFDVQRVVDASEVPPSELGLRPRETGQLGVTARLQVPGFDPARRERWFAPIHPVRDSA